MQHANHNIIFGHIESQASLFTTNCTTTEQASKGSKLGLLHSYQLSDIMNPYQPPLTICINTTFEHHGTPRRNGTVRYGTVPGETSVKGEAMAHHGHSAQEFYNAPDSVFKPWSQSGV